MRYKLYASIFIALSLLLYLVVKSNRRIEFGFQCKRDNNLCEDSLYSGDYSRIFKENGYAENIRPYHIPTVPLHDNLTERVKTMTAFTIQITLSERQLMYRMLEFFDKFMSRSGIPYMIYGGTLLGSYRHHDIIPWDDDLDVWISLSDRKRLRNFSSLLEPTFKLAQTVFHDKFFHTAYGKKANRYFWLWPYIDISYFDENSTHIWNIARPYGKTTVFPKSITFPYTTRPLYYLNLPAPKDTFAALVWMYGFGDKCKQFSYSHMIEDSGPHGEILCKHLAKRFPFVEHSLSDKGKVIEVLKYRGKNLTFYIVDEPSYAIAESYSIRLKQGYTLPNQIPQP